MENGGQGWYDNHVYAVVFVSTGGAVYSFFHITPGQETGVFQSGLLQ